MKIGGQVEMEEEAPLILVAPVFPGFFYYFFKVQNGYCSRYFSPLKDGHFDIKIIRKGVDMGGYCNPPRRPLPPRAKILHRRIRRMTFFFSFSLLAKTQTDSHKKVV